MENQILLTSFEYASDDLHPGGTLDVFLEWQGLTTIEEDYTVFVQLIGPDGQLYGQSDMWPVQGTFPTSTWVPGAQVNERIQLSISTTAPPGEYHLEVGMYLLSTNTRLLLWDSSGFAYADAIRSDNFHIR